MICQCCNADLSLSKKELPVVININRLVIKCPNCNGTTPIRIDANGYVINMNSGDSYPSAIAIKR